MSGTILFTLLTACQLGSYWVWSSFVWLDATFISCLIDGKYVRELWQCWSHFGDILWRALFPVSSTRFREWNVRCYSVFSNGHLNCHNFFVNSSNFFVHVMAGAFFVCLTWLVLMFIFKAVFHNVYQLLKASTIFIALFIALASVFLQFMTWAAWRLKSNQVSAESCLNLRKVLS